MNGSPALPACPPCLPAAAGMIDPFAERGVLSVLPVTLVNGWPVRMRAVGGGCCVGLASKLKQFPSVFYDPFPFSFLSYFLPLCSVSCWCAISRCIKPAFFAIANGPERLHICHISHAQHYPDIHQRIRRSVQAVAGFVVAVVAYTACCDVGSSGLCLIGQPASDWSNTSNSFTTAFGRFFAKPELHRLAAHISRCS
jgi:hypothetical protein